MLKHVIFGLILAFIVGYLLLRQSVIDPVIVKNPDRVPLTGPLKVNSVLRDGVQLLVGFVGPESIEVDKNGNLYTGLADGRILKVHPSATGSVGEGLIEDFFIGPLDGVTPVDNVAGPGRPLGLRVHGSELYVADSYLGVYVVNLHSKAVRILVKPDDVQPPMKFPNDLDITKDGKTIYFSDTSSKWNLALLSYDLLEGRCLGRLFKLDIASGEVDTVVSNLCFANGVQLSPDEKTVAVAETSRYRVKLFDTGTWEMKKMTVLPGMPDNIRSSSTGGYWVAVPIARSWFLDFAADFPMLRKLLSAIFPPSILAKLGNTATGLGVELDQNGEVVGSVHDIEGKKMRTVSEIKEVDSGILFAGSYKSPFMVKAERPEKKD